MSRLINFVENLPVSPLTKRRISAFVSNKRGTYALVIFLVLFGFSLFAEFIANDRPIMVWFNGKLYTPVLVDYTETDFGGDFATSADYHDPYLVDRIGANGFIVWPVIRYSHNSVDYHLDVPAPAPPSTTHPLGTDDQGRDLAARLIYGFRLSILFGLALSVFASIIGVFAGAVQGYYGGMVDLLFQRFLEIWGSLPQLFILIIVSSVIVPSFWTLLFILLLFRWTALVGVVRAEVLRARNFDYVRAARALGVSEPVIMVRHVLPNAMVATFTFVPFILSGSIVALTALDFLGLGLPPGSPSLGDILRQGKENLQAPWLGLSGFFTLATLLVLLVFTGEAVRDAFDPRKNTD